MGRVFLAVHRHMDRLVALKMIATRQSHELDLKNRFAREIKTLAKLSHPNILLAYDAGIHHGQPLLGDRVYSGSVIGRQRSVMKAPWTGEMRWKSSSRLPAFRVRT